MAHFEVVGELVRFALRIVAAAADTMRALRLASMRGKAEPTGLVTPLLVPITAALNFSLAKGGLLRGSPGSTMLTAMSPSVDHRPPRPTALLSRSS